MSRFVIVGATGVVGRTMLSQLLEFGFDAGSIHCLASERSRGQLINQGGHHWCIESADGFVFERKDIVLFSAGSAVASALAPKVIAAKGLVIDNSSAFRSDDDIPLIVPEVNAHRLGQGLERGIIANPNCSTIGLMVALAPLHKAFTLKSYSVATYQAISGAGKGLMESFLKDSIENVKCFSEKGLLKGPTAFGNAFNCVPMIDVLQENGYSKEEMKVIEESRKILELSLLPVEVTAVRVPVMNGHSAALTATFKTEPTVEAAKACLENAPGIAFYSAPEFPTPRTCTADTAKVSVGRLRNSLCFAQTLNLWVVSNNLTKGAATNAVQIAQLAVKAGF